MANWLMKSEPDIYSWADLVRDERTEWDGVRNNAARLHLRAMKPGDEAFFYHSGDERAVVGIMRSPAHKSPTATTAPGSRSRRAGARPLNAVTLKDIKAEPKLAGWSWSASRASRSRRCAKRNGR